MPLQATSGAASYDAFGGGVPVVRNYIEDVFSTWLYTGNGSDQTINNGIDLSTKGGMVWFKARSSDVNNTVVDTVRGGTNELSTNLTAAQLSAGGGTAFTTTGFTLDNFGSNYANNQLNVTYASWTFREQPTFFDVVTYTGTGANRTIAHLLGSVPGCIIVKRTDTTGAWQVYHRSLANTEYLVLNTTAAKATGATRWNSTTPTSTVFSLGTDSTVNASGGTYVAYLFAHDAGGFGLTGTDNVISCGSYTGNGSTTGPTITLGYEPQWIMIKNASQAANWVLVDTMREMSHAGSRRLNPNLSGAESGATSSDAAPLPNGFQVQDGGGSVNGSGQTYIYVAIRRGPMKVPTSGTSVFGLSARTGTGSSTTVTGSSGVSDSVLIKNRGSAVASLFSSRLTGVKYLVTSSNAAEVSAGATILQANPWDVMDGVKVGTTSTITNASANTFINYLFKRAPSVFDVVCYSGVNTGGQTLAVSHNLTVIPELVIIKTRTGVNDWFVYTAPTGTSNTLYLDLTDASTAYTLVSSPTASTFTVNGVANNDTEPYIAYLFATCGGVSKVGSYTGNGSTQTIDCGFGAGGARFVLIKRTDATGNWYVYDTARGMTVLTDPYWLTNSSAAEAATLGSVTTVSTGFALDATILAAINTNAASYIFLAIA